MIFALPFPVFLFEIVVFFLLVSRFGFLNIFGLYLLPCLLGFIVLAFQSRVALLNLQRALMEGKQPAKRLLATAANFLAGVLLLVPTFTTRVFALVLLVPGLRQMALAGLQAWIARQIARGTTRVFGSAVFRSSVRTDGFDRRTHQERDAEVIDVTPLEVEHSESSKKSRDF